MADFNPFSVFGDDEEDDASFAALPGRLRESAGTSVYDNAANSIRSFYGKPLTDGASDNYARQSGALAQLQGQLGGDRKAQDRDKWLSVAAALLSPTQTGKTSESIANALGVYAGASAKQRAEERDTSLALAKLMQQYEIADLKAKAAASKAAKPKYVRDELMGEFVQVPGTGGMADLPQPGEEVVVAEEIPVLTPEQVAAIPAGSGVKFRTVDGREGVR